MQTLVSIIDILGSRWELETRPYSLDSSFKDLGLSGYCQSRIRKIVVCDMHTHPDWQSEPSEAIDVYMKEVIRHEILHAFLYESGLDADSSNTKDGWARNEEMIDWFSIQGQKIFKAWQMCHAI